MKLAGLFKQIDEADGRGSLNLGGYVDALLERPYCLATAYLKAFGDAAADVRERYDLQLVNLFDRSSARLEGGSGEEALSRAEHLEALLAGEPVAVCFSAYCWNIDGILRACGLIKEQRPQTRIVLGGRAAAEPARLLAEHGALDYVVEGEAELPFVALLRHDFAPEAPIPGVWRRLPDGTVETPDPAEIVDDLDSIPSPYLAGVVEPAPEGMMLELSRGCANDCGYCAWNSSKVRRRFSGERIAAELSWAVDHGVRHITIVDSAINYEMELLEAFVRALERADPHGRLTFTYNLRHEQVDAAQIALLRRVPAFQILLGLESLSSAALHNSDRAPVDRARFEAALELVASITPPVVGVVLGLPGDTLAGFIATMEYLGSLAASTPSSPIGAILVSLLQVFPGTGLSARSAALGLQVHERGIPYLVEHPGFSSAELGRALGYLHRFKLRFPVLVKGPEGLTTLLERLPDRGCAVLEPAFRPWKVGGTYHGWVLHSAVPRFDGEGFGTLHFRAARGGRQVAIRLDRRDDSKECYARTGLFNLYAVGRSDAGDWAAVDLLIRGLAERVARSEPALQQEVELCQQ